MRLSRDELEAIREKLQKLFPDGRGFLFGSLTDDNRRGRAIEILVLTSQPAPDQLRRIVLLELEDRLGENKGSTCSSHTSRNSLSSGRFSQTVFPYEPG